MFGKNHPAPNFLQDLAKAASSVDQPDTAVRSAGIWQGGKGINEVKHRQDDLLHRIAVKYKPTKRYHNYIKRYSFHFAPMRESVRRFVEIGVQTPSSLLMWEEYFPNAEIIGIDIDEKCREFSGGRKRVLIGDQKDPEFIARLVKDTGGEFDIIIDDGEHSEVAILTSLQLLLPHVASHGIYAVEDLVDTPNVATCLHAIERAINYWPSGFEGKNWPYLWTFDKDASWLARNVTGVHFYRYLCLIQRGFNPEDNPYLHMESPPAA